MSYRVQLTGHARRDLDLTTLQESGNLSIIEDSAWRYVCRDYDDLAGRLCRFLVIPVSLLATSEFSGEIPWLACLGLARQLHILIC